MSARSISTTSERSNVGTDHHSTCDLPTCDLSEVVNRIHSLCSTNMRPLRGHFEWVTQDFSATDKNVYPLKLGRQILSSSRREKGAIRDIATDEQRRGRENWAAIFMSYLLDAALAFQATEFEWTVSWQEIWLKNVLEKNTFHFLKESMPQLGRFRVVHATAGKTGCPRPRPFSYMVVYWTVTPEIDILCG